MPFDLKSPKKGALYIWRHFWRKKFGACCSGTSKYFKTKI